MIINKINNFEIPFQEVQGYVLFIVHYAESTIFKWLSLVKNIHILKESTLAWINKVTPSKFSVHKNGVPKCT